MNAFGPVQPHDLLWGLSVAALPEDAPDWVIEMASLGHPVVVRRARVAQGFVAVGVRGRSRDQRYATTMVLTDISCQVVPEQLIDAVQTSQRDWPALRALRQIRPVMETLGLPWGVSGSAGYELASGVQALHQGSDLDLILRTAAYFDRGLAAELVAALDDAVCRIDLQLQTPTGAIALREWAGSARQVLLKSDATARLVSDPWQLQECAA